MLRFLAAAVLAVAASGASAQQPKVAVETESLVRVGGEIRANFSARNNEPKGLGTVFVDCTFFDGKYQPFTTQVGMVQNLKPGEKAYGKVAIPNEKGIQTATCRLSSTAD